MLSYGTNKEKKKMETTCEKRKQNRYQTIYHRGKGEKLSTCTRKTFGLIKYV